LPPAETLALQAMLHAVTGRKAEARAEADEAIRLDPKVSLGWEALARVHSDEHRMEEAQRAAGEAVRADPRSAVAHHLLGTIAWRQGDAATAETELARAVELSDALAASQVMLAVLRNGMGRPADQVIPHVKRALALEPGNAQFQVMLSAVLRDRGDAANARLLADRALRMARTPEERARVQKTLADLERTAPRRTPTRSKSAVSETTTGAAVVLPTHPGAPVTVDDAQAFALYGASCEAGEAKGCEAAGHALRLGKGVARDPVRAAASYEKGCAGGEASSCHHLALLYAAGEGVAGDPARAKSLFAQACKGGHEPACKRAAGN
jgi:tetratricopeptide (TPR) repeat protein